MSDPVVAQKGPYEIEVTADTTYAWCRCGLSKKQPLCDGAHTITDLRPIIWQAEKDAIVYLCGCKQSRNKPYCDSSHNSL
tara:strand:- start:379 stop:618 length:240 start_codon:yes stop_codon:yes gene_type:complete